MSRALDYLLAARPQAMSAYFAFLKDAGSHLDPKTRALISVITKVAVQTEKGLLQYTRRALRDGASADEILDALLMAFPALGLSRIVWAIEVLMAHGVEGFEEAASAIPDAAAADPEPAAEIIEVGEIEALPEQRIHKVDRPRRPLLLWREGGQVRAFRGYCTHQGMDLMPATCDGRSITCAVHGWTFTMPDGRCSHGERWGLAELPVTIRDGLVSVEWR